MKTYVPGKKEYAVLSADLENQLKRIVPSSDGNIKYYPCAVKLGDGSMIENVYILPAQDYINEWGIWPEDDEGKYKINITEVSEILESPNSMPAKFSNQIYKAGESGMGNTVFTVVFNDNSSHAYVTGNAVDFINYPPGKSKNDIEKVLPHKGRESAKQTPKYYWCLYGTGSSNAKSYKFA